MRARHSIWAPLLALAVSACADPASLELGAGDDAAVAPRCEQLEEDEPVDGPLADDDKIAEAQQARAGHGLASDEDTVRAILEATDAQEWVFGFPHTAEELEELETRGDHGELTGQLRQWAEQEARDAFAGLWIEQAEGATVHVAFTEDVGAYADEIAERFEGSQQVRVVDAEHTYAELRAVQDDLGEEMEAQRAEGKPGPAEAPGTIVGTATAERLNRVSVSVVGGDDDDMLADLTEQYGEDLICFDVLTPPEPQDPEGPVRPLAKADGWRTALEGRTDAFAILEIAWDPDTATQAWDDNVPADLEDAEPDGGTAGRYRELETVDFDEEALVVWTSGESGSCPGWLADVEAAGGGDVAVGRDSASVGVCTDDYNPYRMVVAVDRRRLPEPDDLPGEIVEGAPDGVVTEYPLE